MEENEVQPFFTATGTGKSSTPYEFTAPAFVWGDVLQVLSDQGDANVRKAIAKNIQDVYSGTFEDDDTEFSITPTKKNATGLTEAAATLGFELDLSTVVTPEKGTATPRVKAAKEPTFCLFSGLPTGGGKFRPGYDMKMRGALIRVVENTNLSDSDTVAIGEGDAVTNYTVDQAIDKLVEFGWYTEDELTSRRAAAFKAITDRENAAKARAEEKAKAKAAKEAEPEAEAA